MMSHAVVMHEIMHEIIKCYRFFCQMSREASPNLKDIDY